MSKIKKKIAKTILGKTVYELPKDFHKLREIKVNGKKLISNLYKLKPIAIKYELHLKVDTQDKELFIEYI
jgi:hypothetical protein